MTRFLLLSCAAVSVLSLTGTTAHAQYYPPGPPQYRYDDAPPPPDPYDERRGYERRGYEQRGYERLGFRCEATAATPRGGRSVVCPLRRPRPVGAGCECPAPPPPPGYSFGPPLPGQVIP